MNITINGERANITLENEKTVGEVLVGINKWLESAGMLPAGLAINGRKISLDHVEEAFALAIDQVRDLNIDVTPRDVLAAEAWDGLKDTLIRFEKVPFAERKALIERWHKSPHATFLAAEDPAAYDMIDKAFGGEGASPALFAKVAEERIRECSDPQEEIASLAVPLKKVKEALCALSLALQTGKDAQAADTVQDFCLISQKMFRLASILARRGVLVDTVGGQDLGAFVTDFSKVLGELTNAYDAGDTVLIGDLAEYECVPRIEKLFGALQESAA